jgi:peptidyl-prolyl cis-trans isomerase C
VNGAILAGADIMREAQNHAGVTSRNAWEDATRGLIIGELLLQQARSRALVAESFSESGVLDTDDAALIRT